MPEAVAPANQPEVSFDAGNKYYFSGQSMDDTAAASTVSQEYQRYSQWRQSNVDPKWVASEELYEGKVEVRLWDGTNKQRSAIPNNMAFDHVEGMTPYLESAFFDQPEWFSVEACEETDARDARKAQKVLEHYLSILDEQSYADAVMEICLAIKDCLFYGTGFWEWEWDGRRPVVKWLDPANVFTDPGCPSPNIEGCSSVIVRADVTIDQVRQMRDTPGMNVPRDGVLYWLAQNRLNTLSDSTIRQQAAVHGELYTPGMTDLAVLPSLSKLTLLRRISKDRIIWTLNDQWTLYNERNPYGCYNMAAIPCRTVKGRLHGIGLPWSIRYPQRYSEAWLNNMSDEAHLAMNPPKGAPQDVGEDQLRTYPGARYKTGEPDKLTMYYPPGATFNAFPLIQYIEQLAGRRNGFPELAQGIARPGNINRTRAGIQQQTQPTDYRLAHIAHHIERYGFKPMFYKMAKMIRYHTLPTDVLYGGYREEQGGESEPIYAEIFHRPMRFKFETAAKMLAREKLGGAAQVFAQYVINGPVMQGLAQVRKKLDFEEFAQMVQDSVGSPRKYALITKMTDEEVQAMNQPSPDAMMKSQDAQRAEQTRVQIAQGKFETEIAKEQIKKQPDQFAAQMEQQRTEMEMQKMAVQAEIEQRKATMQIQRDMQKMQMDMQKMEQELAYLREKNAIEAQSKQRQAEAKMLEAAMGIQAKQVETRMGLESTAAQHQMAMQSQREQNDMNRQSGELKLQQQKRQMSIKKPSAGGSGGSKK